MAPSQRSALALLGLVASIHAAPAAFPKPQFSLGPISYSISWETGAPNPTPQPTEDPEGPDYPSPTNQISLGQPSYSISWETAAPTPQPTEDPEGPGYPSPTNQISLGQPSYSISWDTGIATPSSSRGSSSRFPSPPCCKGPSNPSRGLPANTVTLDDPAPAPTNGTEEPSSTRSVPPSWTARPGKSTRTPQPTKAPAPAQPQPNQPGSLNPPSYTVIWGKRQEDEPEPTEFPDPEDPSGGPGDLPPFPFPTPPNSIGIQPPQVSISWGRKREPAPETNSYGFEFTRLIPSFSWGLPFPPKHTGSIIWNKRQDGDAQPSEDPNDDFPAPSFPTPTDSVGIQPPEGTIIWGRDVETKARSTPKPTATPRPKTTTGIPKPTHKVPVTTTEYQEASTTDEVGIHLPTATIIWGKDKRAPEPQAPIFSFVWPSNIPKPSWAPGFPWAPEPSSAYVSWGKRDAQPEPTAAPDAKAAPQGDNIGLQPPAATMSWGKERREPEPQGPVFSFVWPTNIPKPSWAPGFPWAPEPSSAYVSWGKRDAQPEPTAAPKPRTL